MNHKVQISEEEYHGSLVEMRKDDRFFNFLSFLGADPQTFTIGKVTLAAIREKQVPCCELLMNGKPCKRKWLVTAKANQNALARAAMSNRPDQWTGLVITLFSDPDVTFGREKVGGIRIKEIHAGDKRPKTTD